MLRGDDFLPALCLDSSAARNLVSITQVAIGRAHPIGTRRLGSWPQVNQDFVTHKLGKLRGEKQRGEGGGPVVHRLQAHDIEANVEAILGQLKDFPRIAAQGTIEERKLFVRGFVSGAAIQPHEVKGVVKMSRMPVVSSQSAGSASSPNDSVPFDLRDRQTGTSSASKA